VSCSDKALVDIPGMLVVVSDFRPALGHLSLSLSRSLSSQNRH